MSNEEYLEFLEALETLRKEIGDDPEKIRAHLRKIEARSGSNQDDERRL